MSEVTGACLCGTITYRLAGPASTPLYTTVCHCVNCKRWTGSAFLTAAICPREGFTIRSGTSSLKSYIDTRTDSRKQLTRQFCGKCGSNLFARTPLRDDIVSVAAGTLDGFEKGEWQPGVEQYCVDRNRFVAECIGVEDKGRYERGVQAQAKRA